MNENKTQDSREQKVESSEHRATPTEQEDDFDIVVTELKRPVRPRGVLAE